MKRMFLLDKILLFVFILFLGLPLCVFASDTEASSKITTEIASQDLGKKLQNPVANLISVPFQNNFEYKLGKEKKGFRYTLKLQPVVPTSLNEDWLLVLRPIIPYIRQHDVVANTAQEGIGDLTFETFFSPKKEGPGGLIWGVGPVFLFPTAASNSLGDQKYGIGPTGVVLKQAGPWTIGILANHIISFAGNDSRKDISATYMQPFWCYTTKKGFTAALSSESTYDWKAKDQSWTIPLIGTVSQILPICGHYVSVGLGGIYYAQAPTAGPKWGIRFIVTLLFPEKSK